MIFLFPTLFLIFNPFQSIFSATRILPQLLFILGGEEVGELLVIIQVLKEKSRNRKSKTCAILM
jgi:hypothetical protein